MATKFDEKRLKAIAADPNSTENEKLLAECLLDVNVRLGNQWRNDQWAANQIIKLGRATGVTLDPT